MSIQNRKDNPGSVSPLAASHLGVLTVSYGQKREDILAREGEGEWVALNAVLVSEGFGDTDGDRKRLGEPRWLKGCKMMSEAWIYEGV